jgi:hypothetical protein
MTMRVLVMIKANKESEAGVLPSERLVTEMGKFNEELVKAGVLQASARLRSVLRPVDVESNPYNSAN